MTSGRSPAANFLIEEVAEGRSLVVTGPWSTAAAENLLSRNADGLMLNYERGYPGAQSGILEARLANTTTDNSGSHRH